MFRDFRIPKINEVLKTSVVILIGVPLLYLIGVIANLGYEVRKLYKRIVPWR